MTDPLTTRSSAIRCPSCGWPTTYDFLRDWHKCDLCERGTGRELLWRKSRSRLGRLWIKVMCG